MRKYPALRFLLLVITVALIWSLLPGCGGGEPAQEVETDPERYIDPRFEGAPSWVIKGRGDNADLIYGVGTFSGVRDIGLATDAAMARARNQIVLNLQAEVRSLLESGQIQTDDGVAFDAVQEVSNTVAQVGNMNISGAMMEDKWLSSSNELWVLASIDMEAFGQQLDKVQQLSGRMREEIHERVQDNLNRLDDRTGR